MFSQNLHLEHGDVEIEPHAKIYPPIRQDEDAKPYVVLKFTISKEPPYTDDEITIHLTIEDFLQTYLEMQTAVEKYFPRSLDFEHAQKIEAELQSTDAES